MAVIFVSAAAIQLAAAQVSVDVSDCVELTKPEERLACFEAQVEAARQAPPAAAAPAAAAPVAASSTTGADSDSRAPDEEEPRPEDVIAKVAELREILPNAYLITLDNGQVWRQTVPDPYPLRQGSDVRIYYSRWRSFRLTSPQLRGFIQVERAR